MRKKIGLITTLNMNIGDEFIRDGIIVALEKAFPNVSFEYFMVHKHDPLQFYKWGKPFMFIRRGRNYVAKWIGHSTVFDDCDAIIQCGAPIFWKGCSQRNSWQAHLWNKVLNRYRGEKPILNLAGGSSFAYLPETFDEIPTAADAKYIEYTLDLSTKTTVRDKLAKEITKKCGREAPLIPCSAFLSSLKYSGFPQQKDDYIIINYMEIGGHYTYGMKLNVEKWKNELCMTIRKLANDGHRIVFVCHNEAERNSAQSLGMDFEILFPSTREGYMQIVSRAKVGICNRMHCAVVLASFGVPAIAVGNDTRIFMAEQLELPIFFCNEVDAQELYRKIQKLLKDKDIFADKMVRLQEETIDKYVGIMKETLPF